MSIHLESRECRLECVSAPKPTISRQTRAMCQFSRADPLCMASSQITCAFKTLVELSLRTWRTMRWWEARTRTDFCWLELRPQCWFRMLTCNRSGVGSVELPLQSCYKGRTSKSVAQCRFSSTDLSLYLKSL